MFCGYFLGFFAFKKSPHLLRLFRRNAATPFQGENPEVFGGIQGEEMMTEFG